MKVFEAFDEIMLYAHFWNWVPDWNITKEIYKHFPNSYSVLLPFTYTYLEEVIRSTTSEYGIEIYDENGKSKKRSVGKSLINLAIEQNKAKYPEYTTLLEDIKSYFDSSTIFDEGDKRNSVSHGYMHPRFWNKESFERLILDIAKISKYANF